jgi:hypothetical protein
VSNLTNVYIDRTPPNLEWFVREIGTGICVIDKDRAAALKAFDAIWAGRSPYQLVDHAPPRPKRPDAAPQQNKLLEHESMFRKAILRRVHSDLVGERTFTADQVAAIVNDAWEQTRPKA